MYHDKRVAVVIPPTTRTALQRAIELGSDVGSEAARRELARLDRGARR